ncbi:SBF complex DNA-binding subunit SWI4 Ecym_7145 [Eremothecium cymbalariae DBVPG|uniref:HTH APSES-type domain-containing protein n=1 Tax=Eremothecium cymbalariae (strain CBS 270.75 / DBVPG 7215 / KCTC 17166 / NRRL Y-17582) TaxID=931890 RepID=G8JVX9_ERECY|nr:hypothetical protein Ecym_7145 [Eremothecium cymbalariae DBVPG\
MGLTSEAAGLSAGGLSVAPVIEVATYAGVDVYECYCRGKESNIVMRRLHDDWVNITQVFKVASFTKTQRTKVLEKESTDINHEKIQGGYGRFQGTWIPLLSAQNLVAKYCITDIVVLTLINFKPDPMNMPPRRSKNSVIKKLSPATRITSPSSYNKTPKKKITEFNHSTAGSVSKKAKKRASSKATQPSPLQNLVFQTPQHQQNGQQTSSNYTVVTQNQQTPLNTVMIMDSANSEQRITHPKSASGVMLLPINSTSVGPASAPATAVTSSTASSNTNNRRYATTQKPLQFYPFPVPNSSGTNMQGVHIISENPNQKQKSSRRVSSKSKASSNQSLESRQSHTIAKRSTTIHNEPKMSSFTIVQPPSTHFHKTSASSGSNTSHGSSLDCYSSNDNPTPNSSRSGSPPPKERFTPNEYKNLILQVLSTEYNTCEPVLPEKLYYPPIGLDVNFTIDKQGHTALHWATAMANIPLIKILLTLEADVFHCNDRGFNCITKSIFYNNCYKTGAFVIVVELLKICLVTPDTNGRLPLHYLVELSVNKSKDPLVTNYYIDTILDILLRDEPLLLKMCLNLQDTMGNTVFHLAALNMNLELCNKLYYMGSSMEIMNSQQQTVMSILSKMNVTLPTVSVANTPIPVMMPTPVTATVNTTSGNQETFKQKQSKLNTPLRPRCNKNKSEDNKPSAKKQVAETTFTETPQNLSGISNPTLTDFLQVLPCTNSKTPSYKEKVFALDRITEMNSTPVLKVTTPGGSSANEANGRSVPSTVAPDGSFLPLPLEQMIQLPKLMRISGSNASKLAIQFSELSKSLTNAIDENIANVGLEVAKATEGIDGIEKSLKLTQKQEKDILNNFDVEEIDHLEEKVRKAQSCLNTEINKFANSVEKSQALTLATLVHEEEAKADRCSKENMVPTSSDASKELFKLGVELSILQLKRKHVIEKVCNAKTIINLSNKIYKYRKLIGMSIENIDSKLNDIESDLRGTVA